MKSLMKKSAVLTGAFLLFAGANAGAADWGVMEVKVPFPFTVTGQTMPAGTYMIQHDAGSSAVLIRGENHNHAAAFAIMTPAAGQDPAGAKPTLTFTRYEKQYQLANVWESNSVGWSIPNR